MDQVNKTLLKKHIQYPFVAHLLLTFVSDTTKSLFWQPYVLQTVVVPHTVQLGINKNHIGYRDMYTELFLYITGKLLHTSRC